MTSDWQLVGTVGVDAGLVMVGDPCYAKDKKHPVHKWDKFCDSLCKEMDDGAMQLKYAHGAPGLGVVVQSGWGDGEYPVYVKRDKGIITEVKVVFDGDDEN